MTRLDPPALAREKDGLVADKFATIDDYIDSFPEGARAVLTEIRRRIHRLVPAAGETISYGIPTITVDGRYLVYFAGWKKHISVYPLPETDEALEQELAPYKAAKATLRFPLDRPVPYELIERVVARLVELRASEEPR